VPEKYPCAPLVIVPPETTPPTNLIMPAAIPVPKATPVTLKTAPIKRDRFVLASALISYSETSLVLIIS